MKKILSRKKLKYQEGMGLVEVIAALGIATLTITALVSLSISTLRTSLDSKLLLEGSKIANREIELVRAFRDGEEEGEPRSWESFIDDIANCIEGSFCHINSGAISYTKGVQNSGKVDQVEWYFTATKPDGSDGPVEITDSVVRISVSVSWMVGNQQKGAYIYTDLSNWRGR